MYRFIADGHNPYVVTKCCWSSWKKPNSVNSFLNVKNLSWAFNDKCCMVVIDGYDYRDNCRLNDDQKYQMFFWLSKCSVIMQRHAPLLRKYDMYHTDGNIFGKTFLGK